MSVSKPLFRFSKSLIRKCSTLPPTPTKTRDIFNYSLVGGAMIGGCVGGCVGVTYIYNDMRNTSNKVDRFIMFWFGGIFGTLIGALIGGTYLISLPILGFMIWDEGL